MRLVGRGHEAIRATHAKTLELIAGTDLSGRGTCIVAVGVRAVGQPLAPLAGPVRITIDAGPETFLLQADANSGWSPDGPAVVRRGPLRLPGTFAVHADAAAADLPRGLAAALTDPGTAVHITVEAVAGPPSVVLLGADAAAPATPQLRAEVAAADVVIAEDAGARRLVADVAPAVRVSGPAAGLPAGRLLVLATAELPGRSVRFDGRRLEVRGLPAPLAVAAAAGGDGPVTYAGDGDVRTLLRGTPATHRLVLRTDRRRLPELLAGAHELRGTELAAVAQDLADPVLVPTATADAAPPFAGADRLWCCLLPAGPDSGVDALDPSVHAAVTGLLADGVATKPAARALAALTGWPQRRAYDAVVARTGSRTRRPDAPPARD